MAWLDQNHLEDVLQSTDIPVLPLDCLIQKLLVGPEHQYVKKKKPTVIFMLGNCGAREDLFVLLVPSEAFTPPYWDPYFSWLPWWHFILIPTPSPSPHLLPLLSWFRSSVLRLNRGAPQCPKPPSLSRLCFGFRIYFHGFKSLPSANDFPRLNL